MYDFAILIIVKIITVHDLLFGSDQGGSDSAIVS